MNTKKVLKFITGSGFGVLIAFAVIVTQYSPLVSPRISLATVLMGIVLLGTFFLIKVPSNFLSAPVSYISGFVAVLAVMTLGLWGNGTSGGVLFAVIVVSTLLPLYYFRPLSILDALLSGPEYFGGAITALAVGGVGELLVPESAFGATFVGTIGALVMLGVSAFFALVTGGTIKGGATKDKGQ
ncbi:hypothetical protein [Thermococcus stetteri]|uniref:hypothetical protein n=1 Tax=Thermococcus stetteri TaxID=49900 RepID=UPI001AE5C330|nr:hypothetical protein [Thermococcus stetteri]MBP1912337.1 hypothetical protein [Thermococcus stetteri]